MPEVERFSRLALAVDAIRKKDYRERRELAEAGAGIRSRPADHQPHDRLGEGRRRRAAGRARPTSTSCKARNGTALHQLSSRADRRSGRPERQGRRRPIAATLDNVGGGSAAPDTWLRAAEAYAGFLARKGRQGRRARRARQGRRVRGRPPAADGAAREDREGRAGRAAGRDAGRRRRPNAAQPRHARSTAAAASPSCGSICNLRWR